MAKKKLSLLQSLREFLWNYPVLIKKFVISTAPVSFISLYIILGAGIFASVWFGKLDEYILKSSDDRIVEGTVGTLGVLNPMFIPHSQVDRDIQALLFEKFLDVDMNGDPLPVIAKSWNITSNGRVYDFVLDDSLYWSDGEKLDADDVIFTFQTATELSAQFGKDTFGNSLDGVKIEKTGRYSVRFTTNERNATFFESVAVYIVPEHRFEGVNMGTIETSIFEDFPVGSGPYRLVRKNSSSIQMERNSYYRSDVNIRYFEYRLYPTVRDLEVAFRNSQLDAIGNMWLRDIRYYDEYSKNYTLLSTHLPFKKKIMFVNNRVSPLSDSSLRAGLNLITDREGILEDAQIDGVASDTTFAQTSWAYEPSIGSLSYNPEAAVKEFGEAGYSKDEVTGFYETDEGKILTLTLTYLKSELNDSLAKSIQSFYEDEGVLIDLDPQGYDQMTQETLATRDFELLLYELEITVDPDQYNLWHSLRVDYPNLNLAGYSFNRADILLERARENTDVALRSEDYEILQRLLVNDAPVVVLYEPEYNYVVGKRIKNVSLDGVFFPAQRFSNVADWRVE